MHHPPGAKLRGDTLRNSTTTVNEQFFGSSIPDNHYRETPQHVDKPCHLGDPTSTTDSWDESSTLDAPDDHLLDL